MDKKAYIHTIGCQMNVHDSHKISISLQKLGYLITDNLKDADLVIVNTCAIREKAQQKVRSIVGRLCAMKHRRKNMIIGITGCVAQQEGRNLLERFPLVDFVAGTHAVERVFDLVSQIEQGKGPFVDTNMTKVIESNISPVNDKTKSPFAYVTIMQGCDNYCTYCVVPYVRGPEMSRRPEDIIDEVNLLAKAGVREVTLLGQNVNSYGKKENFCSFPQLLSAIDEIPGIERIRFVTSHPKDLSPELIASFAELKKLCNHIHLPVQSGSSRILKRMNRKYTAEDYFALISAIRDTRPDIAITTDFIVGFPGEDETDFNETMKMVEKVGFDNIFAFAYSKRPQTPASGFKMQVDEDVKLKRLNKLLQLQAEITAQIYESMVGQTVKVMVEGISKNQRSAVQRKLTVELTGRSSENRIVNFEATVDYTIPPGELVSVFITKACANSLHGVLIENNDSIKNISGGDKCCMK